MQSACAEALSNRRGRRGAELELIEDVEVESGDLDTIDLPSGEPALLLQKMENRLVRQHLANPDVLSSEELRKLRYILNFARLADFEPGAAGPGGSRGRRDVSVEGEIAPCRSRPTSTWLGQRPCLTAPSSGPNGCAAATAWPASSRCASTSSPTPCSAVRTANGCACRTWQSRSTSWSPVFASSPTRRFRHGSVVPNSRRCSCGRFRSARSASARWWGLGCGRR